MRHRQRRTYSTGQFKRLFGNGIEPLEDRRLLAGDWVTALPNSRLLSELSIPGTHDALSDCNNGCFPSGILSAQAQTLSLQSQLDMGIRALDVRVDHAYSGTTAGAPSGYTYFFGIVHGLVPMGYEFRDDVMLVVAGFLAAHPGEMIVMSIQEQDALTPATGRAFIDTFEQYMNDTNPHTGRPYGDLFWQPVDAGGVPTGADFIPTLGETRGKIVLLQDGWDDADSPRVRRWGLDYTKAEGGDPQDANNARYYNPLFQKVDSSPNLHPEDRWANSQSFFVETAVGRYQTPAGQPKFYENSLASTGNRGIPGSTAYHWDSPLEYVTGKGCVLSDCRYDDGLNQRALSYLQGGQPRSTGIVYMDFPELGNAIDWDPDHQVNWGSTLIDTIVDVNFGSPTPDPFLEEITFYDDPNTPGPSDIECQLFADTNGGDTDFRNDSFNCDNDDAQSLRLRGLRAGTKLLVHDSPNFLDEADNAHIQIVRDIPGTYTIGTFEQTYNDDYVQMQYYGDGTLDGKVSAVRIAYNGISHPETSGNKPFTVDYLEVPSLSLDLYLATSILNNPVLATNSVTRFHTARYNTINFSGDAGRSGGEVFPQNETFPDGDVRDRSSYIMQARGDVRIPPGQWSIAIGSDDGGQLTLEDIVFDGKFNVNDPQGVSGANQVWYNAQRAYGWTGGHFTVTDTQLTTTLLATMFEHAGGDSFEIAIRDNSDSADSSDVRPDGGWVLLRDGALGWSVGEPVPEMTLLEEGGTFRTDAVNIALDGTAFAKDLLNNGGYAAHQIPHLNDGVYGNSHSWIGDSPQSFAGINLGDVPRQIDQLAFGRSNVSSGDPCPGGVCTDRSLGRYTLQYTQAPNPNASTPDVAWITFGELNYLPGSPAQPHLRHLYAIEPILATGIRVWTPDGAALDEIELYTPGPVDVKHDITSPGGMLVIVNGVNDDDSEFGPPPANEQVERALDDQTDKHLNFVDLGSGLVVTPSLGPTVVDGIRVYTANDFPERDPASYRLEGSNNGIEGPFTVISQGNLMLPDQRNAAGITIDGSQWHEEILFSNTASYTTYRLTFPTLKNALLANSMQIGEVELLGTPSDRPPDRYRVNAGGVQVAGDPVWSEDSFGNPSSFHDAGPTFSTVQPINISHPSIPANTPMELFQTERYPSIVSDVMRWDFPVEPGDYEVRLYFAELFYDNVGDAVFDVDIEDGRVLTGYDILSDVGTKFAGIMKRFVVESDENLDIDFRRIVGDPVINAIEILPATPPVLGDLTGDGGVDAHDINALFAAIGRGATESQFDLDGNGSVAVADVRYLVEEILGTFLGDANLDFHVDGIDLAIWREFRFQQAASWATADFNGSGAVDGADFNIWNQNKFATPRLASAPTGRIPRAPAGQAIVLPITGIREPVDEALAKLPRHARRPIPRLSRDVDGCQTRDTRDTPRAPTDLTLQRRQFLVEGSKMSGQRRNVSPWGEPQKPPATCHLIDNLFADAGDGSDVDSWQADAIRYGARTTFPEG